jgi:predicted AAA+ superfamily ATPase
MTYIPQKQLQNLSNLVQAQKVLVIYGAKRVGKTTLLNKYVDTLDNRQERVLFVNGDDIHVRQYLGSQSIPKLISMKRNILRR